MSRSPWLPTFLLLLIAATVPAQQPVPAAEGSWTNLRALAPQTHLQLATDHGRHPCTIQSVTEEQIVCENASYPRPEVRQARLVRRGRSTAKGLLIGLGVGAGVGVGVGAALGNSAFKTPGRGAAVGIAIFAPLGGAIGALSGLAGAGATQVLYQR